MDAVCEKYMQYFKDNKVAEGIALLKLNSVIPGETIDKMQATIEGHMVIMVGNYGKILSYEFIQEKKIKDVLAKRYYLLKFERFYVKFDFTLYNGAQGWTIVNFNYNEELAELFQ